MVDFIEYSLDSLRRQPTPLHTPYNIVTQNMTLINTVSICSVGCNSLIHTLTMKVLYLSTVVVSTCPHKTWLEVFSPAWHWQSPRLVSRRWSSKNTHKEVCFWGLNYKETPYVGTILITVRYVCITYQWFKTYFIEPPTSFKRAYSQWHHTWNAPLSVYKKYRHGRVTLNRTLQWHHMSLMTPQIIDISAIFHQFPQCNIEDDI